SGALVARLELCVHGYAAEHRRLSSGARRIVRTSRFPTVVNLGETENPPDKPRLCVLGGATKNLVMIEVEVDHIAGGIDRKRADVMAQVVGSGITPIIISLLLAPRIMSARPVLVAVEKPTHERKQQQCKDSVPFLCLLGESQSRHGCNVVKRFSPVSRDWGVRIEYIRFGLHDELPSVKGF